MAKPRTLYDKSGTTIWSTSTATAPPCFISTATSCMMFEPAGVRVSALDRPQGRRPKIRWRSSTTKCRRPIASANRPGEPTQIERWPITPRFWHRITTSSTSARHRPIIGRAGFTLPGTTSLRRQSHRDHGHSCARLWHRHVEVGTCSLPRRSFRRNTKNMRVTVDNTLPGVPAKTSSLRSSARSATARPGIAIEYAGDAIRAISMEGR